MRKSKAGKCIICKRIVKRADLNKGVYNNIGTELNPIFVCKVHPEIIVPSKKISPSNIDTTEYLQVLKSLGGLK
jgi:hypothetical protein